MLRGFVLAVVVALVACNGGSSDGGGATPTAATPIFTPPGGTYTTAQGVVISTTTPGATLYYTTDGSAPSTNSTVYATAIPVSVDKTLKAIATATGYATSAVGTATYAINAAATPAATPVISPGTGSYTSAQLVSITCSTPGASIYYTLDGTTTPTANSTPYGGAFQVAATTTVKAIATAPGHTASPVAAATLTINTSAGDFATFCAGLETSMTSLMTSCYKASPDWVALNGGVGCAGLATEILAGRLVYEPTQAAGCAAAVSSLTCTSMDQGGEPAACRLALVGQVPSGSVCYDGTECPNGYCSATAGACPGLCVPYATAGQPCSRGDECAAGLVCDYSTNTCGTPSAAGGPCPCLAGHYCDGTSHCAAQKTSGSCTSWDQCAAGYTCLGTSTSSSCVPMVGAGAACSTSSIGNPSNCGYGYHCASGYCAADLGVGQTCAVGDSCVGGSCDGATLKCVARGGRCDAAPGLAGLALYDAFAGTVIDGSKWQNGGFNRGVAGGVAVLSLDVGNERARSVRNDNYALQINVVPPAAGQRTTTLQADVSVPSATAARTGSAAVFAAVRLLYSPPSKRLLFPGAFQDLLITEVGLMDDGSGLKAFRRFSHCDDAACVAVSTAGVNVVDPAGFATLTGPYVGAAAAYDTPYTLTLSLNEATGVFGWTIAGGTFGSGGVSGTANPADCLAATAGWAGLALSGTGFQGAALGVRSQDLGAGGGTARITGRFDNVRAGFNDGAAAAFDDFSGTGGNSGPTDLSPAKWNPGGATSIGPSGGSLVVHDQVTNFVTAGGNSITVFNSGPIAVSDPAGVNAIQADLEFLTFTTIGTGAGAGLVGRFYNDGTGTRANDATGDVQGAVTIGAVSGAATFGITRCSNASCATTVVGNGTLPGSGYNTGGHRLLIRWDAAARRFTFGVDGKTVVVDPTTAGGGITAPVAYGGPARAPSRILNSYVNHTTTTAGTSSGTTVRWGNVYTGP